VIHRIKLVVDASVAVKWYIPEPGSERAARVLAANHELLAPDLLLSEFGNVLWKKVRRGELLAADANQILAQFLAASQITYPPIQSIVQPAFEIATRFGHPIYDAMYIAIAAAHDCQFVTADDKLVQAFLGTPFESAVASLAAF
jgi:predicted nucleic acid-binding protein